MQQQFPTNPFVQEVYEESERIRQSLGASTIDEALQIVNKLIQQQEQVQNE